MSNTSGSPVVFVITDPEGQREQFYSPSRRDHLVRVGEGGRLTGPIEVREPSDDINVGAELLGEMEAGCEGGIRIWRGHDTEP